MVTSGLGTLEQDDETRRWHYDGPGFHDLRRTSATALVVDGVDVKTTQYRLGHSSPMLTLDVYAQAVPQAGRKAADTVGDRLMPGLRRPASESAAAALGLPALLVRPRVGGLVLWQRSVRRRRRRGRIRYSRGLAAQLPVVPRLPDDEDAAQAHEVDAHNGDGCSLVVGEYGEARDDHDGKAESER